MDLMRNHDMSQENNHRVMIIDDDLAILENMAIYLRDSGYVVNTVTNGNDALELFLKINPELVLCDLRIPDIDGLKLIESFTRQKPEIPIIVISGARQIKDVIEAIKLGAIDYLVKPITDFNAFDYIIESALSDKSHNRVNIEQANSELADHLQLLKIENGVEKRVQMQLLPEPNKVYGHYSFQHRIIPGSGLSSNFVDYFEIDDNYIGFYSADVSAQGENAVFASMLLKSLINQPLRQYRIDGNDLILCPGKTLDYLNKEMIKTNIGKFISLFYAVIDRKNNTIRYCPAGLFPTPILINGNELIAIDEEGLPVGLFKWAEYQQHRLQIKTFFTLGLFSQGILDSLEEDKAHIKLQRLTEICRNKGGNVTEMIQQLQLTADANQLSDISIFIIQRQ